MDSLPFRFGSPTVFSRVREFFQTAGFDERTFTRMQAQLQRQPVPFGSPIPPDVPTGEFLIRLFNGSTACSADFLRLACQEALDDLLALGLVQQGRDCLLSATVRVRPMFGLYVLSDLLPPGVLHDDFVLAPDDPNTLEYLSYIPMLPCGKFLEACGGSGIAGLAAVTHGAQQSYSSDIAPRSTAFARFSAALSGIEGFHALTGDAYQPVEGITFDRIALHPPYMPALNSHLLFHSGGQDGEQITRKHIVDLPGRLNPGGRLYCRCMGSDRTGSPYEQRIREWLGDASPEYDVAVLATGYSDRSSFLVSAIHMNRTQSDGMDAWEAMFDRLQIECLVMTIIVIQRRDCERPVFTVRREKGPHAGNRELEWLLQFETARAARGHSLFLDSPLKASPAVALHTGLRKQAREWAACSLKLEVSYPFPLQRQIDSATAALLPQLDGKRTGREVYRSLANGQSTAASEQEFAARLADLAAGGFLFVDGLQPPAL